MSVRRQFDYIILGAGSAGCVLANKLSADPSVSVLLVEAGPLDKDPFIHMPKGMGKTHVNPRLTYAIPTEPEPANAGNSETWLRGKVMGGSSAINGMMYVRGQPEDYDAIAEIAGPDWSWHEMGRVFAEMEGHELGAGEARGGDGPLKLSLPEKRSLLNNAVIDAGKSIGLPEKRDINQPDGGIGVGYAPLTICGGRRQSAAVAFIDPVRRRANLTLMPNTSVDRILTENGRTTGVELSGSAGKQVLLAHREVILSAGALHSPAILLRSGIGPADELRRAGIVPVLDSPFVGKNMREHRVLMIQYKVLGHGSDNAEYSNWRLVKNVTQYYLTRRGPMAGGAYEAGLWIKTREGLSRPNGQILFAPFSYDFSTAGKGPIRLEPQGGMHFCAFQLRPQSLGEVKITSPDPAALIKIKANYHDDKEDRRVLIELVRFVRKLVRQPAFEGIAGEETFPGPLFESDEEIIEAYDKMGGAGFHAVGTCAMGKDKSCVLTPDLRVRGVDGLRVIDASAFPAMPAGNTNGPVMALAWRAAELIQRDQPA